VKAVTPVFPLDSNTISATFVISTVPQRGMHGDPNLPTKAPRTHRFFEPFVPVATLPEARYLTGILNAPAITAAIAGYAAQLSLGQA
jgi:hypothetical protein